jgi:hypothetical protein
MDDFVSIFLKSARELGKSPILLLAGFVVGALSLSGIVAYGQFDDAIKSIAGNFSQIVLPLLVMPFIMGGALGYAVEVRKNGSSSLATFLRSGGQNYVRMLMAAIIAFIAFYILFFAIFVSLLLAGMGDPFTGSLLLGLTMALAFLCLMAIEFYDISIVAEEARVVAAFKNSIGFVKRNLLISVLFFVIVIALEFLLQMPIAFGLAGAMMSNQTYYDALMNASLAANASNATAANATALNMTSLFGMGPAPIGTGGLVTVGIFQVILQGFVFAFIALYKTEFYLSVKGRKKITDFDYEFKDETRPQP